MKTELMIFAIIAMVASSFLNAETSTQTSDNLAVTKQRIQHAGQIYAKSQLVKTVATNKSVTKPNEG